MFGRSPMRAGVMVLGVQDDASGRQAVREAAAFAAEERAVLHLVTAYELRDSHRHRADRACGPHDVEYLMCPRADAETLVRETAAIADAAGATVVKHVHHGSLRAGVRRLTRDLASAPAPVTALTLVPAPAPVPDGRRAGVHALRVRRGSGTRAQEAAALARSLAAPDDVAAPARMS